jgi:hypothetical protein
MRSYLPWENTPQENYYSFISKIWNRVPKTGENPDGHHLFTSQKTQTGATVRIWGDPCQVNLN